ncbi:MAG: EAL domain-containing protein [Panacagrimonas sp.]
MTAEADPLLGHAQRLRGMASDLPMCHASVRAAFDEGQFDLVYQPILRSTDLWPVACEALLRWTHPQRGPQSPAQFIPILERSRVALDVGDWLLQEAGTQLRHWQGIVGKPLRLCVNVAPLQILSPEFPGRLERSLDRCGVKPESLSLELTQAVLMDRPEAVAGSLRRLRELGLSLELDDFGGGPSMLAQIRALGLSGFKLDRRFLTGLGNSGTQEEIRTLTQLARQMGLHTTAEGVETETERASVVELGVDRMQGFLFGQPLSAEAFDHYLTHHEHLRAPRPG